MQERIAILGGLRTPFSKSGGQLAKLDSDDLAAILTREFLFKLNFDPKDLGEVIIGNVSQPVGSANSSRIIARKAGIPAHVPACTVHRNCASGMEAITTAAERLLLDRSKFILAGGTECMSKIPLLYGEKMTKLFADLFKAKSFSQKLTTALKFRPSFLAPIIGIKEGLTDPICNLNMGQTAEVLAREFQISREEQDQYALASHQKASVAQKTDFFKDEIMPIAVPPKYGFLNQDDGIRHQQSIADLSKLRPYFDRDCGSVTVGNACQVTDGAAMVLMCKESTAKEMGYQPIGYLKDWSYAGLEGERMGLGPVYATSKLIERTGQSISDFERIELNEAFATQVIANQKAFASQKFAQTYLGRSDALGEFDPAILNPNGGAIAIGHPVGATGTRLVITLLNELRSKQLQSGLATLCIGGGQGAALALELN
jgi:acetyl-CoA C-acetyltransferase/acetyl-CoA acyltransferase